MSTVLQKLLSIAGPPLETSLPSETWRTRENGGALADALADLLGRRNGFVAFESALVVRPAGPVSALHDLASWNDPDIWKRALPVPPIDLLCFAEDIFGEQFALSRDAVVRLNPETGEAETYARDLDDWAGRILNDYEVEVGYPLARDWQKKNGPIPLGSRLVPKIPFVMGGTFDLGNLYLCGEVEGMRVRAEIASQLRGVPDGTKVKLTVGP
jgi:hypothetical protein